MLHGTGFALGYAVSKALGLSNKIARTNSIEVSVPAIPYAHADVGAQSIWHDRVKHVSPR